MKRFKDELIGLGRIALIVLEAVAGIAALSGFMAFVKLIGGGV